MLSFFENTQFLFLFKQYFTLILGGFNVVK